MLGVLSLACAGLAATGASTKMMVTLGGTATSVMGVESAREMQISVPEAAITPAGLAAAQYIAALPEMVHGTRDVLCSDSLCALTFAACGSKVTAFQAPGEEERAQALQQVAEAQQLHVTTAPFDLMADGEPLPIEGSEKQYYGAASGRANLLLLADCLSDEASARRMAVVVGEAVKISAWVILADQGPSSPWRELFLELLEKELAYVDCGHPHFDDDCIVEQPELGWQAEPVALLRLNAPMSAAALNTGFGSLEERRGFALPPPTVQAIQ